MRPRRSGFLIRHYVAEAPGKGRGVFAAEPISAGSVVWRHLPGVFAVFDEAAFRERIRDLSSEKVVYELTHVHAFEDFPGCLIRALDDGILINHADQPTLMTDNVSPLDPRLNTRAPNYLEQVAAALGDDRYSLVATRDIAVGEELANDYRLDDDAPDYFDRLYEQYGVVDDYLDPL